MTIWEYVTLTSSNHYGGHQARRAWSITRTWDSYLMIKTLWSLMNQTNLCITIHGNSSVLWIETTWFVSMVQPAKPRHRKHSCWSITESVRTATGPSPWCRLSRRHLLTGNLKMMHNYSSFSNLKSSFSPFSCFVRDNFFLNLLKKELIISLMSRWNLMNSDVWTWS